MRSLRLVRVSRVLRLLRAIRVIRELRMMVFSIMSSLNVTRCGNLGARDIQCLACNLYLWPYHRIIYVLYVYCIMMIRRVSCAKSHPWIGAFGKRRGKRAKIERYKAMSCSMSGLWKWFFLMLQTSNHYFSHMSWCRGKGYMEAENDTLEVAKELYILIYQFITSLDSSIILVV